jgi:hypothetical protein
VISLKKRSISLACKLITSLQLLQTDFDLVAADVV